MISGAQQSVGQLTAQAKEVCENSLTAIGNSLDHQIARAQNIAGGLREVADRIGGGKPRDANDSNQPGQPMPAAHTHGYAARNATLARILDEMEDELRRIASGL